MKGGVFILRTVCKYSPELCSKANPRTKPKLVFGSLFSILLCGNFPYWGFSVPAGSHSSLGPHPHLSVPLCPPHLFVFINYLHSTGHNQSHVTLMKSILLSDLDSQKHRIISPRNEPFFTSLLLFVLFFLFL